MKVCPFCDGELRDDAIKCWHCTMALLPVKVAKQNILEQKEPPREVSKITEEPPPRPSSQQSAVGKPHIEKNKLKAKTLYKAVIISISIIIVLAGILFTIANLNKWKELVSVATPKVEAPVAQPVPAPDPVPDQPTGPTSNEDLERIAKEKHFITIKSAHPDFDNLRDSGRIVAWIQKQPSRLRDSLLKTYNEGDADSVIALLNQFKKDKNRISIALVISLQK